MITFFWYLLTGTSSFNTVFPYIFVLHWQERERNGGGLVASNSSNMATSNYSKNKPHILSLDRNARNSRKVSMETAKKLLRKPDKRCSSDWDVSSRKNICYGISTYSNQVKAQVYIRLCDYFSYKLKEHFMLWKALPIKWMSDATSIGSLILYF